MRSEAGSRTRVAAGRATIRTMRRILGWIAGLAGIAALGRVLSRRARRHEDLAPAGSDPAEELRRRIAATRGSAPFPGAGPAGSDDLEPFAAATGDAAGEALGEPTLDERRARVHARTREAIEAMRTPEA